ncbi:hypothetical protein H7I53_11000 [Mycolicibacterium pulveris]|nr:hypothetical protein [Mycolicibacterium pulveris]MCV6980744.1 hypothetical protein [Mycolicibacterium pulveris]
MASAGVIAVNPLVVAPTMPEARAEAVNLTAFANPLTVWQQTFANTFGSINRLGTDVTAAQTALFQALLSPSLSAELLDFVVSTVTNPQPLLTALVNFPSEHGPTIGAALEGLAETQLQAFLTLPPALIQSASWLAQGQFVEAFSAINVWFLVNFLGDSRQTLLDLFKVPGDFLESIGLYPLARVSDAILTRGVIGNLGRALLTAQVTSTIQAMEILDRTREALTDLDFVTAASELINLPAKFVNAFLNGYVPDFATDPNFPPQKFPGLFAELGFFDFFFVQIPNAIAGALVPPAAATTLAVGTGQSSPTDIPGSGPALALSVDSETSSAPGDDEEGLAGATDGSAEDEDSEQDLTEGEGSGSVEGEGEGLGDELGDALTEGEGDDPTEIDDDLAEGEDDDSTESEDDDAGLGSEDSGDGSGGDGTGSDGSGGDGSGGGSGGSA